MARNASAEHATDRNSISTGLPAVPADSRGSERSVSRVTSLPRKLAAFIRNHGPRAAVQETVHRAVNWWHERRLGVDTMGRFELADIGIVRDDLRDSMPIGYHAFLSVLKRIPLEPSRTTFMDYGVGKGRAVCAAATFPFRRIVGIELSRALSAHAQANLDRMKHRKVRDIDVQLGDATTFGVPDDVNLIYFFNPFAGDTLRRVVDNIYRSWCKSPRKIHFIYFNNDHFDDAVADRAWIRKIDQRGFYPRISCGVYETTTYVDNRPDGRG